MWLGSFAFRIFAVKARLHTFVDGTLCCGTTARGRPKKKVLTGCLFVVLNRRTISFF